MERVTDMCMALNTVTGAMTFVWRMLCICCAHVGMNFLGAIWLGAIWKVNYENNCLREQLPRI